MFNARFLCGCAVVASALTVTFACAGPAGPYRYPTGARQVDQRSYERGYAEGRRLGAADAARRRTFDYARHNVYRRADQGYGGRNVEASRNLFRQGFVAGYRVGYGRQAPVSRRGQDVYGNRPPVGQGPGRFVSPARELGYRDGFEQGRDDRRDGDRHDPIRAARYRSGDRNYNSRYGSREVYQREYRAAFVQGYEQGYGQVYRGR